MTSEPAESLGELSSGQVAVALEPVESVVQLAPSHEPLGVAPPAPAVAPLISQYQFALAVLTSREDKRHKATRLTVRELEVGGLRISLSRDLAWRDVGARSGGIVGAILPVKPQKTSKKCPGTRVQA